MSSSEAEAGQLVITNYDLCQAMKNTSISFTDFKNQQDLLQQFVLSKLNLEERLNDGSDAVIELKDKLKSFLAHVISRYRSECCKFDQLLARKKNYDFLQNPFQIPKSLLSIPTPSAKPPDAKRRKVGRQPLPFTEKSVRAQQSAAAKIRQQHDPDAILRAASQQPTPIGKLIRRSNSFSGQTASKALKAISSSQRTGKF